MRLKTYNYIQWAGTQREWTLTGLILDQINLIVGKNASGKTRALNVISSLGKLVSGRQKPSELATGVHTATFEHLGRELYYLLNIEGRKVVSEEFRDGDKIQLLRGVGGIGRIFHEKEGKMLDFQTPEGDAAVVSRRDSIQHRFLEPLGDWGEGVRHYSFGTPMGKDSLAIVVKEAPPPDPREMNAIVALFRKGVKEFPNEFAHQVQEDMRAIGYDVTEVGSMAPTDLQVFGPTGPAEPYILFVRERDLPAVTQQTDMSQGMFRAFAVIIHLAYAKLASKPSLIIVDDIGEGLDFERSCKLINLLRTRTRESQTQLLISTNDKFVMNEVPLNEWSVLRRQGNHVTVLNHHNSKTTFEEFKFTGLSNFSFFEMDFANSPPEEVFAHEEAGGVR
jgi:energy-coupling factor transporter ATP-binding protein EcfA2